MAIIYRTDICDVFWNESYARVGWRGGMRDFLLKSRSTQDIDAKRYQEHYSGAYSYGWSLRYVSKRVKGRFVLTAPGMHPGTP